MKIFNLIYRCMGVKFGQGVKLQGFPVMVGKGKINIGDRTTIKSSFLSNLVGLYQRTVIVARTPEAIIEIGRNVGMSGVTLYARQGIRIGNNCRIGGNTKILDNDFHPTDPQLRLEASNKNMVTRPIVINDNVFIGCNCLVLKGVTIGENSTIGAGSVVTKDVPPNCVAVGNPARIVRKF